MMPALRRSTRNRREPSRYGEWEQQLWKNDLNYIIEAIEILENVVIKIEDPIDKHISHYNNQGISVKKTGKNSLVFIDEKIFEKTISDNEFKIALINANGNQEKWIEIVEKGIKQWKEQYVDLTV
tara:strand:- start:251 stop:625 length:375 start_codon:yes stop_codon:yes gene_type:complete